MYDSFLGAKGFPYINLCTPPKALGRLQSRRGDQSTLLFLPHLSWHRILALLALQNAIWNDKFMTTHFPLSPWYAYG